MACSQTHKIRASCSGIRDPAKYIPKRDMKSSTVDMDFNFLKTVQSTRDKGHSHLDRLEKGESLTARRKVSIARRRAGLSRAGDCGVQVRKMSKVMERAQRNMTRWDAKYTLWVCDTDLQVKVCFVDDRVDRND
jgi:hypothetical protein